MNEMIEFNVEVDEDLYNQVKEMYAPQGITPEQLVEQFIRFCAAPETQEQAKDLLLKWKQEYEKNK